MRQTYGYVRVSTRDQNEDRQYIALEPYGIPKKNIFVDRQSGKDFERPAYKRLLRKLKPGDLLVIKSIDRLGRNYEEVIEQWRIITRERLADIKVIDMPLLDTTYGKDLLGTFISDLVLSVLSYAAQLERENIRQRQAEGIAAARQRGVRFGRPRKRLPEDFDRLLAEWKRGDLATRQFEECCGMSMRAILRRIKEREEEKIEKK